MKYSSIRINTAKHQNSDVPLSPIVDKDKIVHSSHRQALDDGGRFCSQDPGQPLHRRPILPGGRGSRTPISCAIGQGHDNAASSRQFFIFIIIM